MVSKTSCPPDICYLNSSRAISFNLRVISHFTAEALGEGHTPDLSLASVMSVCTQTVFLVPSWPESCPAQICVCAAAILFRPVTVASRTVSSSRLSAEEVLGLTFRPSDLCLGSCSQKRAWGSECLALWPWCTVPKYLPQQQGCIVPSFVYLSVLPSIQLLFPHHLCVACAALLTVFSPIPPTFLKQYSVDPISGP